MSENDKMISAANELSNACDCDVMIINGDIYPLLQNMVIRESRKEKTKRKRWFFFWLLLADWLILRIGFQRPFRIITNTLLLSFLDGARVLERYVSSAQMKWLWTMRLNWVRWMFKLQGKMS